MEVSQFLRAVWLLLVLLLLNKSLVSAVFENCDNNYKIYAGYTYRLASNNYPKFYNPGSSCRYKYTAPVNHKVVVSCVINLYKERNGCTTEAFYVAKDGDLNLRGSEKLCGAGSITRQSLFRTMVLAYISHGPGGKFICNIHAEPKPCECGYSVSTNIANGKDAAINEYPSMVALKTRTSESVFLCAAVIISHRYLVTAAHCALFQSIENIAAWVGTNNMTSTTESKYTAVYYISNRIVHPNYSPNTDTNDIALLLTSSEITFSRAVGPICLPPSSNVNNDFSWVNVDVIGWGAKKFAGSPLEKLQKITVSVIDNETCKSFYPNGIHSTHICTRDAEGNRKDSCQFDSGGPVIYKHQGRQYLVGIISYGKVCAAMEYPVSVNTRITSFLSWINFITTRTTCSPAF